MTDEITALRRVAQVLARVATPSERQNIARRVAQKSKGDDSELALSLPHAAALFWPGHTEKTAEVLSQITRAFDAGELGGFIPREHRHVMFEEFAVWPDCPAMAADSPLRYWLPLAPTTTSQPEPQAAPTADAAPDPERRLAALRALGGSIRWLKMEWTISGIQKLVQQEKAQGRKRSDEKTIRLDLKEAADAEARRKKDGQG